MPDATTTNFGYTKPTVGSDSGTWGDVTNDNWDAIDGDLHGVKTTADAALPAGGGTMTGPLVAQAYSVTRVAKGNVSGAVSLDLSLGNYFTMTVTGDISGISFTNVPVSGQATPIILEITNGGAHTITYGSAFKFPSGTAPVLTSSGVDILGFVTHDAAATVRMVGVQKDVR